MCSAAWRLLESGYELGFNRDEKWTRPPSSDPGLETHHPVAGVCARDTGVGGTWLFTNECGISLAVMNSYPGGHIPRPGVRSRGWIPLLASGHRTLHGVAEALNHTAWYDFAPCEILLISPAETLHYAWDGFAFSSREAPALNFLSTSSVNTEEITRARLARFELLSTLPLSEILDDATADDPSSTIFVTREDVGTVSQTLVTVDSRNITFSVRRRGESSRAIIFPRQP